LIQLARQAVVAKFGIDLELEIQPLGNFPELASQNSIKSSIEVQNE
jgi:hypothetical protein